MLTAKEAKELSIENKGISVQLQWAFRCIKTASVQGSKYAVLPDIAFHLHDFDLKVLETLGYTVTREATLVRVDWSKA
jgi:hypothetical protein